MVNPSEEVEQPPRDLRQHLNNRHDIRNHIERRKNSRHAQELEH